MKPLKTKHLGFLDIIPDTACSSKALHHCILLRIWINSFQYTPFLCRTSQKSGCCSKILGQGMVFTTCVESMQNHSALVFCRISRTSHNTNNHPAAVATATTHVDHKRSQQEEDYQKHSHKFVALLKAPLEVKGIFYFCISETQQAHPQWITPASMRHLPTSTDQSTEQWINSMVLPEYLGLFLIKHKKI